MGLKKCPNKKINKRLEMHCKKNAVYQKLARKTILDILYPKNYSTSA